MERPNTETLLGNKRTVNSEEGGGEEEGETQRDQRETSGHRKNADKQKQNR